MWIVINTPGGRPDTAADTEHPGAEAAGGTLTSQYLSSLIYLHIYYMIYM